MYLAHHDGRHIRLAVADHPAGPWTVSPPAIFEDGEEVYLYDAIAGDAGIAGARISGL